MSERSDRKSGERSVGGREYVFALGPMDREARKTEGSEFYGQMSVHQCRLCAALVVEDFMPEHEAWHQLVDTQTREELRRAARQTRFR